MKLFELFDRVARMYAGKVSTMETAREIYGEIKSPYSRRLQIYNNIPHNAAQQLETALPLTKAQLDDIWHPLCLQYYVTRPWGRFDYFPDGEGFPDHLAASAEVPAEKRAWLAELAAIEWAQFRAIRQPASSVDRDDGDYRLAPDVAVFRLRFDLAAWMRAHDPASVPVEKPSGAVAWAAGEERRVARLDDYQLVMLELLRAGALELAAVPASTDATLRSLEFFRRVGLVHGPRVDDAPREDVPTLGRDLAAVHALVPFAALRWEAGNLLLWSPLVEEAIACDDLALVDLSSRFATGASLRTVIDAVADTIPPSTVVEVADALHASGLLVAHDVSHPAVGAGWTSFEAGAHAIVPERGVSPPTPPRERGLLVAFAPGDDRFGTLCRQLVRVAADPSPSEARALIEIVVHARGVSQLADGVYRVRHDGFERVAEVEPGADQLALVITAPIARAFERGLRYTQLLQASGMVIQSLANAGELVAIDPGFAKLDRWTDPVFAAFSLR